MTQFRIFCWGGLVVTGIIRGYGRLIGDAAIAGSAASQLATLVCLALGGTIAVALFGHLAIAAGSRQGHDSEAWRGAKQARAARSASPNLKGTTP